MKTKTRTFVENKKALYRIGIDDFSLFLRAFKVKSVTLPLSVLGPFDSIHELAHYELHCITK